MNKVIFERWKLINVLFFITILLVVISVYVYVKLGYCIDNCSLDVKKGIINPIYSGGKWLAGILGLMLFVPARIFKKWLLYAASPILLLTLYLVQGISVHSGNLLNPTRAQMAENGMIVLAVVTIIFVIVLWWHNRKKKPAEV